MDRFDEMEKLEKKLRKSHGASYVSDLRRLSKEELKQKLTSCARHLQEIQDGENKDEELQMTKEKLSILRGPYNESKRGNKAISRFVYLLLQEVSE